VSCVSRHPSGAKYADNDCRADRLAASFADGVFKRGDSLLLRRVAPAMWKIFSSRLGAAARRGASDSPRRLDVQYRMHEAIMAFSSREFYDGTAGRARERHSRICSAIAGAVASTDLTTAP